MSERSPGWSARYGTALIAVALATAARLSLNPILGDQFPFATLFFAVLAAALYGGFGPAALAVVAGATAAVAFLLPRVLTPEGWDQRAGLMLFLVTGTGIALLGGTARAARRRTEAESAAAHAGRELLRATLLGIGDGVIATDAQGRVTFLNPVAESLTGWPLNEAVGEPLERIFHIVNEATRGVVENPALRAIQDGRIIGLANHTVLIARDGTERPIDDSAAPVHDSAGTVAGAVLVFRDISDKKRGHEERQELLSLIETSTDLVGLAALDGSIRYFNDAGIQMLGLADLTEARTKSLFDFVVPEDAPRVHAEMIPAVIQGGRWEGEWRYRNVRTGEHVPVSKKVSLIRSPTGEPLAFATVSRDVTDRRRAEEAIRAAAERLALALAAARLGDWSWDTGTDLVTLSPRAAAIFGIPAGPHMTWTAMQELIHPEDRERTRREVERAVADGRRYDIEYRVTRPDGSEVWVAALGRAQYGGDGTPIGMFGVVQDVTERKRAEEELREEKRAVEVLNAIGTRLAGELDLGRLLEAVTDETTSLTGAQFGAFFYNVTDDRGESYSLYTLSGVPRSAFERFPMPRSTALFEPTFKGLGTVRFDEVTASPLYGQHAPYRGMPEGHLPVRSYLAVPVKSRTGEVLGGLFFGHVEAGVFSARHERLVEGVAAQAAVAIDNARLYEQARREQARAERRERDARFLADASAAVAALVDEGETLRTVARLAVPHFADWCAVDLLDGSALTRVAVAHTDPAKVAMAEEVHRRFPPDPDEPGGTWAVARTGQSSLVPEITDEMLAASVKDAEFLGILRALGLRSYMGVPLAVRGKVLGVVTFIAAESGRRYGPDDLAVAEDLAHRAAVAVENARLYREVKEADRRKDEFLAMLAHELRNPLAPVRNGLHILKMKTDQASVERTREMMDRQVTHLVRMVDDLMDVSRIMRGRVELRREPLDLAIVVARALETAQPTIDAAGHALDVHLPPEPVWVSGDVVRLTQVLSNLLVNACKYSDRTGRIGVRLWQQGGEAVLAVRDTGIGLAPEDLTRVFDLFAQVNRSTDRAQGGLGIGLTLVKRLTEMHGGSVTARSEGLGKGSEFVVRLPALAKGTIAPGGAPVAFGGATLRRRVLIVDDNVDAAESLADLLRLGDHDVRTAHDGPTGLAAAVEFRPDLIVLDIGLPGMTGYEVARALRATPEFRTTVLAALTGWGQEEDRRRSQEAGFDHHLVKPIDTATLEKLLTGGKVETV